ncbi:MAG: helix-turn-helix domain-containing protein [Cyclobacteriaceae bacterium]
MITNITQEQLDEIIHNSVRRALKYYTQPKDPREEFLSAKEAAAFIGDALPTFYKRISDGEIANYGGGKRINVRKSDLLDWLCQPRSYKKMKS